jgi:hypothetical protein
MCRAPFPVGKGVPLEAKYGRNSMLGRPRTSSFGSPLGQLALRYTQVCVDGVKT